MFAGNAGETMDPINSAEPNLLTRDVIGRMRAVTLDAC
jgi:hypothetical protein